MAGDDSSRNSLKAKVGEVRRTIHQCSSWMNYGCCDEDYDSDGQSTKVVLGIEPESFARGVSKAAFRGRVLKGCLYYGLSKGTDIVFKCIDSSRSRPRSGDDQISITDVTTSFRAAALAETFCSEMFDDNESALIERKDSIEGLPPARLVPQIVFIVPNLVRTKRDLRDSSNKLICRARENALVEERIKGEYKKFNSNSGWTVGDPIMDFFSHWTWVHTGGRELLCDLQGSQWGGGSDSPRYLLTDPVILSCRPGQYGSTDLGPKGIASWFQKHKCNHYCHKTRLLRPETLNSDRMHHEAGDLRRKCLMDLLRKCVEGSRVRLVVIVGGCVVVAGGLMMIVKATRWLRLRGRNKINTPGLQLSA